jgi:hypothetical protein
LLTPAAFKVERHPIKRQGNPTVVRDKTVLAAFSIHPMEVRESVHTPLACASPYNEMSDELP